MTSRTTIRTPSASSALAGSLLACITAVLLGACAHVQAPAMLKPGPHEGRPDAPGERARFFEAKRLPAGAEAIDPAWYARALQQARRLPTFSTVGGRFVGLQKSAPRWESLGPSNVGGRTRTLVFDPRDPQRMLAGGVSGGVFETRDGGASWQPLSDDAANVNIGALVFDPADPDTIYAGTGELYRNSQRPYSAMWGQGILRSTDNGLHFRQLLSTANDDFRYVSDLVISPADSRRLYAATNTGVWRSDNGGATFVEILRPTDGNGGLRYEGCTDLELLPGDGSADLLLASCASRSEDDRYWLPNTVVPPACGGPCPATVFRSDNAAAAVPAWQAVLSEAGMGRTSLAVAPSNPQIVYALSASTVPGPDRNGDGQGDYDNGLHALFRSDDGGRSWTARLRNTSTDVLSTYLLSYADGFEAVRCNFGSFSAYSAGWYNQAIAVNPLDPEIVWVAGMEVYRSTNGGASFGKASYWWLDGAQPSGVHADVHLMKFHPDYATGRRELYMTSDGGVARTVQDAAPTLAGAQAACGPGNGVVPWQTLENGLVSSQFYTGTVNAAGTVMLGGLQDNGTQLKRGASGSTWQHIFGGDGASVAIDPRNDNTLYVSYQNVNIHRSVDGGVNFVRATNGITDTPIFIMPFVIDERAPDRLYAGGTRLWRSNNQGANWTAASAFLGNQFGHKISAIAVSPVDNERLLYGNQSGIRRVANATTSGGAIHPTATPRTGWVSSLTFDPVDPNVAYATYSTFGGEHVWRSADSGASWTAIDGSGAGRLPDIPVHHLVVDPNNRARLYIGTDLGVFVSVDGGQHWAQENAGFANVIVERLAIAPNAAGGVPMLHAFTYGRGVWRAPLGDFDAVAEYAIGPDSSGGFFDPAQDGHGWLIESTAIGGVAGVVASWYTYLDGEPVWLFGAAPADRDTAVLPMTISRGGDFPPRFDPANVQLEPWGTVTLRFQSSDAATVEWVTDQPGFSSGSMALQRLTRIADGGGDGSAGIDACHSGSWFDPAQSGHGLQVEVVGAPGAEQLVIAWFAYLDGEQRWLLGNAPITGDRASVPMIVTRGAQFPPGFDPQDVERTPWGTLQFQVEGPDRARIDWQSTVEGFGSGSLQLQRLTSLLGHACG